MAERFYRRVIRVRAVDSPNVKLGMAQERAGKPVTDDVLVPGVLSYSEYKKRRETWDKVRQCISLDGEFYEGAEVLLYPPDWLNRAEEFADRIRGHSRIAKGIGIDPAEGGDRTTMTAVDESGVIEQIGKKTPDTSVITGEALAFMRRHNVPAEAVAFDRGGGGKQHADVLRREGYPVMTVAFGDSVTPLPKRGVTSINEIIEGREQRYVYKNLRAQMYGELRLLLDPTMPGFAIPADLTELRRQLAPIPLLYDKEGRLRMLPKQKDSKNSTEQTLTEILGCSPDEADSLVLAVYAMLHQRPKVKVGAM